MNVNELTSNPQTRTPWSHIACVIAGVVLATMARFPIQLTLHDASPFILYFPVVVAVAIAFGLRLGLLATLLSIVPADYFWMYPERTFVIDAGEFIQILGFSFAGLSVSWLSEAGRKRKLEEHLQATLSGFSDAIVTTDCRGKIVYLNTAAQVLTEIDGSKAVGYPLGDALNLFAEDGRHCLSGTFQVAVNNDAIEELPARVIINSRNGKRYPVEQKTSRILDAHGQRLGTAILFHHLESTMEPAAAPVAMMPEDPLNASSPLPRIAMVSTHGYVAAKPAPGAADTGGQVVYVLELSRKLAQLGYEVDIWTRQFADQPEIEPVDSGVRIIRVPCGGRNFIPKEDLFESLPEWNRNALKFISKHGLKYELVNSHYWDGGLAGQRLSRALKIPHIHTPHSLGAWKKRPSEANLPEDAAGLEKQSNFTRRISQEALLASADMVVATSPQQRDILLADYNAPAEKCRMVPPGYDDTRFFPVNDSARQAIRKRLGFTTPVVQAIGRLADNKGYELLIKAFAVVSQQMPEAMLHLAIGGKNLTPQETAIFLQLRALVGELGLVNKVVFESFIPDEQLADYYRAADVFVLSSRYEPLGMTAVEVMACGTPTVLTVHDGLYHMVNFGLHGLYADPCNPEDLGIMIFKVLKDPHLRSQLSLMGAQRARSLFAWTGVAQQFLSLAKCREAELRAMLQLQELWNDDH